MPCGGPAAARRLREHRLGRPPPVLGILLGPAGAGRRQRIARLGGREHAPVGVERESLDAAGADVQPE